MLSYHILWLLLFQSLVLTVSSSEHYHIVPVDSTDVKCSKYQDGTCFSLHQLAQTDLLSGGDNLTLSFLPGEHILTREFMIRNFSHVLIAGLDTTVVSFHGNGNIKLSSLSKLHIKNINFAGKNIRGTPSDLVITTLVKVRSHDLESSKPLFNLQLYNRKNSKLLITEIQTAVIENTVLVNNTARTLYVEAENVYIANSEFTANNGGAVYIVSSNTTISNTTFSNNTAVGGGAMVLDSGDTIITKCNFSKNTVYSGDGGGAIYVVNGKAYILDSILTNNVAHNKGGVIYASSSNVFISNSTLTNNSADWSGGMIYAYSSYVSISSCTLTKNSADQVGGVIAVDSSNVSISNCTLTKNSADSWGGVIYVKSGDVLISNTTLTNNSADRRGGVIYVYSSNMLISSSTLINNSADLSGGVIHAESSNVSISRSTLTNNNADQGGGVIAAESSNVWISNGILTKNIADQSGGVIAAESSNVSICNSTLTNNSDNTLGGVIAADSSNVFISNSILTNNSADFQGGVIYVHSGNVSISNSTLTNNNAKSSGGAIYADSSNVSISISTLTNNSADTRGGVIYVYLSDVSISNSTLTNNSADSWGGVIRTDSSIVSISNSTLTDNSADWSGGVIYAYLSNLYIVNSTLTNNYADQTGGVISAGLSKLILYSTRIVKNTVKSNDGAVILDRLGTTILHGVNISDNRGHINTFGGEIKFNGQTVLSNNSGLLGGAISAERSEVYFNSTEGILITNNTATNGGGIFLRESTLFVYHEVEISHNKANLGGGIYAQSSKIDSGIRRPIDVLRFKPLSTLTSDVITIADNTAQSGGGIYATASNIEVDRFHINIDSNTAMVNGGGIYLEQNSDISILKIYQEKTYAYKNVQLQLIINNNSASQYGGGIFVADDREGGTACGESHENSGECFIQTIKVYILYPYNDTNSFNTFMANNTAASGGDIFGGLLDRCTASQHAEVENSNGIDYINKTVASSKWPLRHDLSISSEPMQVIFCNSLKKISTTKGDRFKVNLMAIDQVGNPVNATIHSSVVTKSGVGRLKEGQTEQTVGNQCTELEYNVFSQDSSAQVELYAKGPCGKFGISKQTINITFLPCTCPVGLQPIEITELDVYCQCDCDPVLQQYQISICSPKEGTIQLENDPNIWIGVVNTTNGTGYVISDCPFDYCVEKPVNITLGSSHRIDKQCAYNRSGVLCGECQQGLSLVFATSNCQKCSNLFLLLLIPFALAGIVLVAFIFLLNITIATGTIHGLIFYANTIASNKPTFVPFSNFLTVFISWVNLDLGIEICFYNEMSSQAKVLLQLVFPAYLFLLIFITIIVSKHSSSFAKLLSTRNPVAALATLILLSYSKLIRFIIAALQYTVLDYPDDEQQIVWLYDGNVQYFVTQHIPRLVAAAIILTAGGLFTILLFFGQWLPHCSNWRLMKWTKNTKYIAFMDAYHSPFTPKHRYWLGLLLFALIVQNIISAVSLHPVLAAGCLSVGLIIFKSLNNRAYKCRFNDILETLFLLNLIILAIGTLKVKILKNGGQDALANVSMSIAFVQFVVIVGYHFYKFVLKKNPALKVNIPRGVIKNSFQCCHHQRKELELMEVWDYKPRGIPLKDNPDRSFTPPILTPTTRPDQLREPALDILAPVTAEDYQQAQPLTQDNLPHFVTHTVIDATHHDDCVELNSNYVMTQAIDTN